MSEESSESRESDDRRPQPLNDFADPLAPWARVVALLLGACATGFGCFAIMKSDNQAGTALLLVVGAVLLLLGLQGTPLRRLGSGEHSLELAALRKQRGIELIADAVSEQSPPVAAAIAETVAALESPRYSIPRRISKGRYAEVREAIERCGGQVFMVSDTDPRRHGYDMITEFPSGTVNVDVRLAEKPDTRESIDKSNRLLAEMLERTPDQQGGFVLVSRGPLSAEVRDYNRTFAADPNKFEVVAWDGDKDDEVLARALLRNARNN